MYDRLNLNEIERILKVDKVEKDSGGNIIVYPSLITPSKSRELTPNEKIELQNIDDFRKDLEGAEIKQVEDTRLPAGGKEVINPDTGLPEWKALYTGEDYIDPITHQPVVLSKTQIEKIKQQAEWGQEFDREWKLKEKGQEALQNTFGEEAEKARRKAYEAEDRAKAREYKAKMAKKKPIFQRLALPSSVYDILETNTDWDDKIHQIEEIYPELKPEEKELLKQQNDTRSKSLENTKKEIISLQSLTASLDNVIRGTGSLNITAVNHSQLRDFYLEIVSAINSYVLDEDTRKYMLNIVNEIISRYVNREVGPATAFTSLRSYIWNSGIKRDEIVRSLRLLFIQPFWEKGYYHWQQRNQFDKDVVEGIKDEEGEKLFEKNKIEGTPDKLKPGVKDLVYEKISKFFGDAADNSILWKELEPQTKYELSEELTGYANSKLGFLPSEKYNHKNQLIGHRLNEKQINDLLLKTVLNELDEDLTERASAIIDQVSSLLPSDSDEAVQRELDNLKDYMKMWFSDEEYMPKTPVEDNFKSTVEKWISGAVKSLIKQYKLNFEFYYSILEKVLTHKFSSYMKLVTLKNLNKVANTIEEKIQTIDGYILDIYNKIIKYDLGTRKVEFAKLIEDAAVEYSLQNKLTKEDHKEIENVLKLRFQQRYGRLADLPYVSTKTETQEQTTPEEEISKDPSTALSENEKLISDAANTLYNYIKVRLSTVEKKYVPSEETFNLPYYDPEEETKWKKEQKTKLIEEPGKVSRSGIEKMLNTLTEAIFDKLNIKTELKVRDEYETTLHKTKSLILNEYLLIQPELYGFHNIMKELADKETELYHNEEKKQIWENRKEKFPLMRIDKDLLKAAKELYKLHKIYASLHTKDLDIILDKNKFNTFLNRRTGKIIDSYKLNNSKFNIIKNAISKKYWSLLKLSMYAPGLAAQPIWNIESPSPTDNVLNPTMTNNTEGNRPGYTESTRPIIFKMLDRVNTRKSNFSKPTPDWPSTTWKTPSELPGGVPGNRSLEMNKDMANTQEDIHELNGKRPTNSNALNILVNIVRSK